MAVILGRPTVAEDTPPAARDRFSLLTRVTEQRVQRGLDWLVENQHRRGHWSTRNSEHQTAVSAVAGLSLLASGDVLRRGRRDPSLLRLVRYLLGSQLTRNRQYPMAHGLFFDRRLSLGAARPMHGHGFALLFLAEIYGELHDPALRARVGESIRRGIDLTVRAQRPEGGWYYRPSSKRHEGSVTVTQIQALRAARNAGFAVPAEVIDSAVDYVKRSRDERGGVRYTLGSGKSTPALTAAGLTVLYQSGADSGPLRKSMFRYLETFIQIEDPEKDHYFHYTHFYAAQAFHQRGGPEFDRYYARIRKVLLDRQQRDGSWIHDSIGDAWATSAALFVLQVPRALLPVLQR